MVVGRMAARGAEAKTGERRNPRCPGRAPRAGSGIAGPLPSSPCRALVPAAPAPPESFSKIVLASAGEFPYSTFSHGGVAQLGERLTGSQEVRGSIPLVSTTVNAKPSGNRRLFSYAATVQPKVMPHQHPYRKKLHNLFPTFVHSLLTEHNSLLHFPPSALWLGRCVPTTTPA